VGLFVEDFLFLKSGFRFLVFTGHLKIVFQSPIIEMWLQVHNPLFTVFCDADWGCQSAGFGNVIERVSDDTSNFTGIYKHLLIEAVFVVS